MPPLLRPPRHLRRRCGLSAASVWGVAYCCPGLPTGLQLEVAQLEASGNMQGNAPTFRYDCVQRDEVCQICDWCAGSEVSSSQPVTMPAKILRRCQRRNRAGLVHLARLPVRACKRKHERKSNMMMRTPREFKYQKQSESLSRIPEEVFILFVNTQYFYY